MTSTLSAALDQFIADLNSTGLVHSAIVAQHGQVLAEAYWDPYTPQTPQSVFSVSKTFTALAIGFAVTDGKLKVTDRIVDLFPLPPEVKPNANLLQLTVKDVLMMATGHGDDLFRMAGRWQNRKDWSQSFLPQPVAYPPGTHFLYNTGGTYWLSEIVQKVTGQKLIDYLETKLFRPLGITNTIMARSPAGVDVGGFAFNLPASGLLKLGQFILNHGAWNGKQLLPASWINDMTSAQIATSPDHPDPENDWAQGYGYQMWVCRHGAVRADGAFGQFSVIWPKHDAVIAITAATNDTQKILNLIWDNLDQALAASAKVERSAASQPPKVYQGLQAGLPVGQADAALLADIDGAWFDAFGVSKLRIRAVDSGTIEVELPFTPPADDNLLTTPPVFRAGFGHWLRNDQPPIWAAPPLPNIKTKLNKQLELDATYAWTSPTTLEIRALLLPTLFELKWVAEFSDRTNPTEVTLTATQNVSFAQNVIYRLNLPRVPQAGS